MKARRTLRERLSAKRALIGLLQAYPSPSLAEMAGMCGYDFVLLDGEHGVFSNMDYLHALQAVAGTDALALIRLANHDTQAVGRYLDMGADAIVVPNVSTAEQAKTLVRAMEYPPAGTRGVGASLHRVTQYGLNHAAHSMAPRAGACLLVIIESALGVANADDILSVEGVDGVVIGPSDLTTDLGCPGDFSQPAYADALSRIERAASASGKLLGTAPHPGYPVETLLARGHRLLILGSDVSLMREAMTTQVATTKASLEQRLDSTQ